MTGGLDFAILLCPESLAGHQPAVGVDAPARTVTKLEGDVCCCLQLEVWGPTAERAILNASPELIR